MASPIPVIDRAIDRAGPRGFTLIESLLASVVLAISVLGVCSELAASYQQSLVFNQTATAVALGRQLLDEIAAKPLANPVGGSTTPTATALTARSTFTYAGQYNLYTDTGSSLTTLGGSTIDATAGQTFARSVTVTLGATPSGDAGSPASDFALATVAVTMPSGPTIQVCRVLCNYGFSR